MVQLGRRDGLRRGFKDATEISRTSQKALREWFQRRSQTLTVTRDLNESWYAAASFNIQTLFSYEIHERTRQGLPEEAIDVHSPQIVGVKMRTDK